MPEDSDSSHPPPAWIRKIVDFFSPVPQSLDALSQLLRKMHERQLIDADALDIIEGALNVSDQQVREIMIPRSQMQVIQLNASLQEVLDIVISSQHSRFPVARESTDDIAGILLAKDLLPLLRNGSETFSIESIIRPATIIPESKRLNVLLREFREQRYHMALVIDEYGGMAGLVTIEDILEEIVGDIEDETDEDEEAMIRRQEDGSFLVAALTPIETFNEHFDVGLNEDEFDTIGGTIVHAFGRLPRIGESTTLENMNFKVVEGDKRQVKLLKMTLGKEE